MEIEKGKRSVLDGKYEMIRSLGSGAHSKVKLGLSLANNQQYAVKILKDLYNKFITNEIETLGKLKHPNMVNMIEFLPNVEYVKKDGTVKKVTAIVLELASGGEIFEFLFNTGRFSDPVSRYYFHQLIDTLEYIHSQGITHRDLKPENLLFDSSFTLKVADFGFSTAVAGRDGKGILNSYLGTKGYMAPEIVLKTGYSGTAVDLFAAGVILFIMYTGTPPFSEANPNDPYYKLIVSGKLDYFWYAHSRNKEPNFFSAEFKDLMSSMFSFDAAARPKVADIKAHRWFTGPVPTTAQVVEEMERRYSKVLEAAEKEREAKRREAEKKKAAAGRGILMGYPKTRGSLGEAIDTSEIEDLFPNLHLQRKIATYQTGERTQPNDYLCADDIQSSLLALLYVLRKKNAEINLHDNSYKVNAKFTDSEDESIVDLTVRLLQNDENTTYLRFERVDGNAIKFHEIVKNLHTQIDELSVGPQETA